MPVASKSIPIFTASPLPYGHVLGAIESYQDTEEKCIEFIVEELHRRGLFNCSPVVGKALFHATITIAAPERLVHPFDETMRALLLRHGHSKMLEVLDESRKKGEANVQG